MKKISSFLPSTGLLWQILSTSTDNASLPVGNSPVSLSFAMTDVFAYLSALESGATAPLPYMPVVGGMWEYVKSMYNLSVFSESNYRPSYSLQGERGDLIASLQKNPTWITALLSQKHVGFLDKNNNLLKFRTFDVLRFLFSQYSLILTASGQVLKMPEPPQASPGENSFISLSEPLTQLSFSPVFSDGSYAELSLQAMSPDDFKKLNQALRDYESVTVAVSAIPAAKTKSYQLVVKVNNVIGKPVFSYTFKNLVNAKEGKALIPNTVTLSSLNISYQTAERPKAQVVSVPETGFVIVKIPRDLTPVASKPSTVNG
jgi:hypothetical protein